MMVMFLMVHYSIDPMQTLSYCSLILSKFLKLNSAFRKIEI